MFIVNLILDDFQLVTENCPCRDLIHLNNHTTSRKDSSRNWFSFSRLHVMSPSHGHFHPTCFHIHNHTSSRRDTSRDWFSFSQSHFITATQFTRFLFSVWLVKAPELYFPLNQDIPQSTRGQERKSLENVCLWETDTANFSEYFILQEKSDVVFQVELKVSKISLLPSLFVIHYNIESNARTSVQDSTNAKCPLKEEKIQEIQRCLKSFKWRRTTVPQCKGGFPLIEVSALAQAVRAYMRDHYPTTPQELNFHAELKAASHWCWSDDYAQLSMKKVPFNDCRLKIAVTERLKKLTKELLKTRANKVNESVEKKSSGGPWNYDYRALSVPINVYTNIWYQRSKICTVKI